MSFEQRAIKSNAFICLPSKGRDSAVAHAIGMAEGAAAILEKLKERPGSDALEVIIDEVTEMLAEFEGTIYEPDGPQMH